MKQPSHVYERVLLRPGLPWQLGNTGTLAREKVSGTGQINSGTKQKWIPKTKHDQVGSDSNDGNDRDIKGNKEY